MKNALGNVTISKQKYIELLIAEMELTRLESGGVDNWQWYSESLNPDNEPDFEQARNEIIEHVMKL